MGFEVNMTEKQIEAWLGEQVKALGCLYFKFVSPGNVGVPDRIIVLPGGKCIFVELKTAKGRITPLQQHQLNKLKDMGVMARIVRGMKDADDLVEFVFSQVGHAHAL